MEKSYYSSAPPSYLLLFLIYLAAFALQNHIFLNWDVSLLMHTTDRMLRGGQYGIDYFDPDPPMILYLYTLPVLFAKFFSLSYALASVLFTFALTVLSLFLCNYFFKRLEQECGPIYKRALLLPVLAAIFLFLPAMNFAQREHFLLILVFPYFLITALRLHGQKLNPWLARTVGLLAGLGFAIKPYFYISFVFLELYYWLQKGRLPQAKTIRNESWMIGTVAVVYLASVIYFYPTYLNIVLPTATQYYYSGLQFLMPPSLVWTNEFFLFSLIASGFYFFLLRKTVVRTFETVLVLAVLGFSLAYVLQKTNWYYHVLPAFSLACLLWAQSWYRYLLRDSLGMAGLLAVLALFFPLRAIYEVNELALISKENGPTSALIQHLKGFAPGKSLYFFSGCALPYPLVDYLNIQVKQLAQTYWFMPGIIVKEMKVKGRAQADLAEIPVLKKIINDFIEKKADVVVVDQRINCNGALFDYLAYFSQSTRFKAEFANYRYVDGYKTISIFKRI